MELYYKDQIYSELARLNKKLLQRGLYLRLSVVGGAALIFNGIELISTSDIDTITTIEDEVMEVIEQCSLDINNEALDFISNYEDLEFIQDTRSFSNIDIQYLCLGGVIASKMKHTDPYKLQGLRVLLEDELDVEMEAESIKMYMKNEFGIFLEDEDIETFLEETDFIF